MEVELSFLSMVLVRLGEFDLEEEVESSTSTCLDVVVVLMSLVLFLDEPDELNPNPPIGLMSLVWFLEEVLGLISLVELVLDLISFASFSSFFCLVDASSSS